MQRSVVTYICDNCGSTDNVEHTKNNRYKGDAPLPSGWLDIITVDNFGPDKRIGGHYCPECVRAINFALMEVKLLTNTTIESDVEVVVTPSKGANLLPANKPTTKIIADILQKNVDVNRMIDVSTGAEDLFGVSRLKFNHALKVLKDEGYLVQTRHDTQKGTDARAVIRVLTKSDVQLEDIQARDIHPIEVTKRGLAKLFAQDNS